MKRELDRKYADSVFSVYADYSKTFRTWLVAYGIGAPVFFASNRYLLSSFAAAPHAIQIVCLFLLAVALQVSNAFINKWAAWHVYAGEEDSDFQIKHKHTYRFWAAVNELFWVDMFLDIASIALFAVATIWAIGTLS